MSRCPARQLASTMLLGALLLITGASLANEPISGGSRLGNPSRLSDIDDYCWTKSHPWSSNDKDFVYQGEVDYECRLQAAVSEFSAHLATPSFPAAEFADRLGKLATEHADFTSDLRLVRTDVWGSFYDHLWRSEQVAVIKYFLLEIWIYYRR